MIGHEVRHDFEIVRACRAEALQSMGQGLCEVVALPSDPRPVEIGEQRPVFTQDALDPHPISFPFEVTEVADVFEQRELVAARFPALLIAR